MGNFFVKLDYLDYLPLGPLPLWEALEYLLSSQLLLDRFLKHITMFSITSEGPCYPD